MEHRIEKESVQILLYSDYMSLTPLSVLSLYPLSLANEWQRGGARKKQEIERWTETEERKTERNSPFPLRLSRLDNLEHLIFGDSSSLWNRYCKLARLLLSFLFHCRTERLGIILSLSIQQVSR